MFRPATRVGRNPIFFSSFILRCLFFWPILFLLCSPKEGTKKGCPMLCRWLHLRFLLREVLLKFPIRQAQGQFQLSSRKKRVQLHRLRKGIFHTKYSILNTRFFQTAAFKGELLILHGLSRGILHTLFWIFTSGCFTSLYIVIYGFTKYHS